MSEVDQMRLMQMALSEAGVTVFRNNVAQGVVGRVQWIKGASSQSVTVRPGDAVVRGARVLHAGLFKGSSDLVGWDSMIITPDMVGRPIAAFVSIEAKKRNEFEDGQKKWLAAVANAGGISGVAHNAAEALDLVRKFRGTT